MALPKLATATYELELPSSAETIKYRPFLVKEQKVLMMASESKDDKQIIDAVKNIIKSCTFDKVDVDNIPMFDLEYIFIKLRAKSVGETAKVTVKCPDDETTKAIVEVNLDKLDMTITTGAIKKMKHITGNKDHEFRYFLNIQINILLMLFNQEQQ